MTREDFVELGRRQFTACRHGPNTWCSCKVGEFYDALLEAGMTFGEEWEQVGWVYEDDDIALEVAEDVYGFGFTDVRERPNEDEPAFLHRPQGESKP